MAVSLVVFEYKSTEPIGNAPESAPMTFALRWPGDCVMVDHSIFRIDRGALGMINIAGDPGPQIFHPHDYSKGWQ